MASGQNDGACGLQTIKSQDGPERLSNGIAVGFGLIAVVITIYFLWLALIVGYVDAPFFDQLPYQTPEAILRLLKHHNGHLIFFPRLIFWLDDAVFAGRNQFNIAVNVLIMAVHASLFVLFARALGYRSRQALIFIGAMAIVLMFANCQRNSFTWGFQVQFFLVFAAFTAGAYALMRYAAAGERAWLFWATVAGLVSAGSMANGLVTLPLLALLALVYRRRWAAAILAAAAIFAALIYSIDYQHSFGSGLFNPLHMAAYALIIFGNPIVQTFYAQFQRFDPSPSQAVMVYTGLIGLAVATTPVLAVLPGLVRRRPVIDGDQTEASMAWRARQALTAVILFTYASVAITTIGRGWTGPRTAFAGRYVTIIVPLMIATILLLDQAWRDRAGFVTARRLGIALFAVFLVAFAWRGGGDMRNIAALRNAREQTSLAVAVGVVDNSQLPVTFYKPEVIWSGFNRLRAVHKSLFSEPWVQAVGGPLNDLATHGIGGVCEGDVSAAPLKLGATGSLQRPQPYGQVWAPHDQHPTPTLVLVDTTQRVVGLGRVGVEVADVLGGGIRRKHTLAPWHSELTPGTTGVVTVYLLTDSGRRACPIGQTTITPPGASDLGQTAQAQLALAVEGVEAHGQFVKDGTYPDTGVPARPGAVYGSWAGSDANTGVITLRYGPLPSGATAVLTPVLQGPGDSRGLSLRARLLPSGRILAVVEPNGIAAWRWWRVALPADAQGQAVEIQATDNGAGWGQWVGVGGSYIQLSTR
jgi:hypothetical protein